MRAVLSLSHSRRVLWSYSSQACKHGSWRMHHLRQPMIRENILRFPASSSTFPDFPLRCSLLVNAGAPCRFDAASIGTMRKCTSRVDGAGIVQNK